MIIFLLQDKVTMFINLAGHDTQNGAGAGASGSAEKPKKRNFTANGAPSPKSVGHTKIFCTYLLSTPIGVGDQRSVQSIVR